MTMPNPNPHLALADAAEQRASAATPGPWEQRSDGCTVRSLDSPCRRVCITYFTTTIESEVKQQVDDADFIAHARTDVPALAAAVRELDKVNTEQAATIAALQTSLTASERRECAYRAHLEELGYTGAVEEGVYHALQTKLTEALALAYEGYKEGGLKGAAYARGERWDDMDEAWDKSETRAAAERLEDAK